MKPCITDKDGVLKIDDQLCFALYSASRAITKQYAFLLEDMGITYPQYLALMVLWERDGLLIQEIAASMELDSATTTPLIQRLEKLDLVTRQRSQEDQRRVYVFLTPKGRKNFDKAIHIPHGLGCATGISPETAHMLIDEMKKIKNFIAGNE
ncbi:MAG: MarR family transcriptional regulator [Pseudomonadota bacterium]